MARILITGGAGYVGSHCAKALAAYEGARRLLDEHQRMVLSGADRNSFLAAIGRTPDPSPRLVEALKRHRRLFG